MTRRRQRRTRRTALPRRGARLSIRTAMLFALACASNALAATPASREAANAPVPVRVERVRPAKEALPTLRFLKTNRDFFRSRLDQVRELPLSAGGGANALDPRFLAYRAMVNAALAGGDSLGTTASEREHVQLLASVSEFSRLEGELDQMDRLLASQRTRLGLLQADFAGRQRTALAIVVSGWPEGATPDSVVVRFDDGTSREVALSAEERESLAHGGVLELFHGLVEPREQVFEVELAGAGFAPGAPGYVTLAPTKDRLTFLRLDLSPVRPQAGAAALLATTWVHDDVMSANDGDAPRP